MKSAKRYYRNRAAEMRAKADVYIEAAQMYDRLAHVQTLADLRKADRAANDSLH